MTDRTQDFLSLLGYLYLRHGKSEEAITIWEALSVLRPRDHDVSRSLAFAYLKTGQYQRALDRLDQDTTAHRGEVGVLLIRGRALWGLGRHQEARRVIRQISGNLRGDRG